MDTINLAKTKVGEIVKKDFSTAKIFKKYNIDFCCHGNVALETACKQQNINIDIVVKDLQEPHTDKNALNIPFSTWPLDLLIDYVLKIHHRGIREKGPAILSLLDKVIKAHGEKHPSLLELRTLMAESLVELENHLQKEDNILYPFLYELFEASKKQQKIEPIHCGTISNPIKVMMMEHEKEGERYGYIKKLTDNFTTPKDGCTSYHLLMQELNEFVDALYEHIHIENNILFPHFQQLEEQWVSK